MGAALIVFDAPALQDNPRFVQIAEEFTVKAFIAQLVMKALNVLPWAPGLDVKRLDLLGLQPLLHAGGDKLGPVVVGLALSTWGIMRHTMHNLAAYSELFISLLAFYASAASVLNTHFGQVVLPVGEPFGRFKKIKQDNPDDTFL